MISKTEQAKQFFIDGEYKKAFRIFKSFDRVFSKEELKIIGVTFEMYSNERFYTQIGYSFDDVLEQSINIIKENYKIS